MQNVAQGTTSDSQKLDKTSVHDITSSTPQSSTSSPTKSETETFSELQPRFMTDSSESEEDSISEPEFYRSHDHGEEPEEDHHLESSKFLLTPEDPERSVDPETQARLEALLEAAGIGKLSSSDGKHLADHEVLRRLTSSVSCALDEAAAALTRMRSDNPRSQNEKRSLVEACTDGDVGTVRKLLTEGRSVHETTEEGESLLSLACSAGYYELAQVLLAMNANVEDRGIKGDCTPLMEAASAGHVDIVSLLIAHGADVNAQSTSGNTPLMYGCAGGHEEVVKALLDVGANVEDHNENGHTPLMEAASAGHVPVAKILLEHGAGINTHSNEFKESALTLACYKGHLDMVRFLLEAGADQEHKTDEMHTALMEASMDGHVEVARLLLDSGAQVNMPTDSFESPLTLAACGGHVDLAMLLIERGANIEEVNDEGYTPLMEAAREGHEEMVALLLSQGANINAQTEETQETALTLACCGGFLEVADFLIKAGADIELGASTPLMEAAQEGHLDLVRYLLESGADVHAQTQTGDTALTYACENGHTDVADLLLQFGADLEHESEGGRTPLMKACRAGHLCTVQFLISKLASLNRNTTNNDHTPLSLACAGGHVAVVELLLAQSADPFHKLKDNSTMLIEAAKGGHTNVVQLLLDYPHSIMMNNSHINAPAPGSQMTQTHITQAVQSQMNLVQPVLPQPIPAQQNLGPIPTQQPPLVQPQQQQQQPTAEQNQNLQPKLNTGKSLLRKNRSASMMFDMSLTSAEAQQVRTQPAGESVATSMDDTNILDKGSGVCTALTEPNITLSPTPTSAVACTSNENRKSLRHDQIIHKQQILEELQRVERELHSKGAGHLFMESARQGLENHIQQQGIDATGLTEALMSIDLPSPLPITESEEQMHLKRDLEICAQMKESEEALSQDLPPSAEQTEQPRQMSEQETNDLMRRVARRLAPRSVDFQVGFQAGLRHAKECVNEPYEPQPPVRHVHPSMMERLAQQSNGFTQPSTGSCPTTTTTTTTTTASIPSASTSNASTQVQAATQTQGLTSSAVTIVGPDKKQVYSAIASSKGKKTRYPILSPQQTQPQQTSSQSPTIATTIAPTVPTTVQQNYAIESPAASAHYSCGTVGTNTSPTSTGYPISGSVGQASIAPFSCMDVDSETDSNHDTALTLACAGGHEELVEFLLSRGADIEHRDKKGFTPLILAATAGHQKVVEILLNHGADIEAQSERTKDTPLSLACSGGRFEVVELLLNRGANKEHRNVSDYTPLSLAASGGYVNIIKLLLSHGAEINSRTGSKLGISPLMLAAMNGHTPAVKLLLDMGSDINAQIETNRNTALTLACFQGRHEVVSLLLDRKANVEHRAKTGLTPLMEAASGGYVEVGRVLLIKGADVNATPVPSSRDTALTIAADKGHCRFVELLLSRGTQVEVKNKKGNSPLWLAANGGHLNVVDLLHHAGADIDSQDNRKVSCLMAAFRKGHIKVVKWMVNHVTQFPSDQEMTRYVATVNDKELLEKCQECVKVIRAAKETQAAKANKNATILLEELDMEKTREESKKAAAARRRERKKKKKLEKKEEKRKLHEENKKNETIYEDKEEEEEEEEDGGKKSEDEDGDRVDESDNEGEDDSCERLDNVPSPSPINRSPEDPDKEEGDSGIDANSQGSCSSNDVKARERKKEKKKKKIISNSNETDASPHRQSTVFSSTPSLTQNAIVPAKCITIEKRSSGTTSTSSVIASNSPITSQVASSSRPPVPSSSSSTISASTSTSDRKLKNQLVFESSRHPAEREEFEATGNENYVSGKGKKSNGNQYESDALTTVIKNNSTSPKQGGKREEGWKEVVRKGQSDDSTRFMNSPFRSKKVSVPPNAISRVIGRGGSNINAIRGATGAHIEVEKQSKCQGERIITIKGSTDATKQAHTLIAALIKDPDVDILQMLPKSKLPVVTSSTWDKTMVPTSAAVKPKTGPVNKPQTTVSNITGPHTSKLNYNSPGISSVGQIIPLRSSSSIKLAGAFSAPLSRATAPRLVAAAEKRAHAASAAGQTSTSNNTRTTMSYTSAIMTAGRATKVVTTSTTQTFAAKLSDITASTHTSTTVIQSNHNQGNKQLTKSQPNSVAVLSSTVTSTSMTSSQQQTMTSISPKHCRTLPNLSAPPPIQQQQQQQPLFSGKTCYSPSPIGMQSTSMSNGSESNVVSTSSSSLRVTPSPPIAQPILHQQTQQQVSQQSQGPSQQQVPQQMRSTTPIVPTIIEQVSTHQPQQANTPLEYSLFNDTFSKVTQQSMWGGRENESHQKGMNFATVAGGGSSGSASSVSSNKFIDNIPPQVDASKAPGYRGNAMCSPVSNKTSQSSSSMSSSNSSLGNVPGVSPSGIHNPIQPSQFQSSMNYNLEHQMQSNNKSSVSTGLAVTRPVINQQSMDHQNSGMGQFNRNVFTNEIGSRNVQQQQQQQQQQHQQPPSHQQQREMQSHPQNQATHQVTRDQQPQAPDSQQQQNQQQQQHIMSSNSQTNIEVGLFKNNNGGFEHSNVNSSLLKMVPNEAQSSGHPLLPFHPHMQSFAPSMSQSGSVNTTVSMSRLNPRAPDFSSSMHLNNKPQVTMFNAATGIHPNIFAAVPTQPPPSAIQNNNLAMLGNFPLGKYQQGGQAARGAPNPTNISSNGQTRWQFHSNYPHQDPMMAQMGFPNHLGNIGGPQANIDLITGLENGGSPAMSSPSSPAQVAQEMNQLKMEDRKVPRPIGTERAWKNYNAGIGPGGDADSMSWMLNNEKLVNSWAAQLSTGMDRHQMFRSNATYNRVSNMDAELHHVMDTTFQGHLENQQAFPNGSASGISLMPGLTLLPGQYGNAPTLAEIPPPNESNKMEGGPAWGMPDPTGQDKQQQQHPGWNKWTH